MIAVIATLRVSAGINTQCSLLGQVSMGIRQTSARVSSHDSGVICRIFRAYWSEFRLWKID